MLHTFTVPAMLRSRASNKNPQVSSYSEFNSWSPNIRPQDSASMCSRGTDFGALDFDPSPFTFSRTSEMEVIRLTSARTAIRSMVTLLAAALPIWPVALFLTGQGLIPFFYVPRPTQASKYHYGRYIGPKFMVW